MSELSIEERLARLERALTFHDDGRVELRCHRMVVVDGEGRERIVATTDINGHGTDRASIEVRSWQPSIDDFAHLELYADDGVERDDGTVAWVGISGVTDGRIQFHLDAVSDGRSPEAVASLDVGTVPVV
jgi:hypothetical protein